MFKRTNWNATNFIKHSNKFCFCCINFFCNNILQDTDAFRQLLLKHKKKFRKLENFTLKSFIFDSFFYLSIQLLFVAFHKNILSIIPNFLIVLISDTKSIVSKDKTHSKFLVLGLGARRTFWLSSSTPLGYLSTSCSRRIKDLNNQYGFDYSVFLFWVKQNKLKFYYLYFIIWFLN